MTTSDEIYPTLPFRNTCSHHRVVPQLFLVLHVRCLISTVFAVILSTPNPRQMASCLSLACGFPAVEVCTASRGLFQPCLSSPPFLSVSDDPTVVVFCCSCSFAFAFAAVFVVVVAMFSLSFHVCCCCYCGSLSPVEPGLMLLSRLLTCIAHTSLLLLLLLLSTSVPS